MFNQQKKYFQVRIQAIEHKIWDSEFDRFKLEEIREEVRQEYDHKKGEMAELEVRIKQQKDQPTMDKGEIARLEDKKVLLQKDIDRHVTQMKDCEMQITGVPASAENPEGVQGINQQIDVFRAYKEMLTSYIKQL